MSIEEVVKHIEEELRSMPLRSHVKGEIHARPSHISEIVNRLEDLKHEQSRIQRDLGRPWTGPTIQFPTRAHRAGWRVRAQDRLSHVVREKGELKTALKQMRNNVGVMSTTIRNPEDPYEVLNAAYAVIRSVSRRTGRLEPEEQAVADVIRDYLYSHIPPSMTILAQDPAHAPRPQAAGREETTSG